MAAATATPFSSQDSIEIELLPAEEELERMQDEDEISHDAVKELKKYQLQQTGQRPISQVPVPIVQPPSGAVTLLTQQAQRRKIALAFTSSQGSTEQKFYGELQLGDAQFRTVEEYRSKKHAKESVAQLGLDYLKDMPMDTFPTENKAPSSPPLTNYVVRLQILCQKHGSTLPVYKETECERAKFNGTLTLPNTSINDIHEPGPFTNKKNAREAVAKRGLELLEVYIREQGAEQSGDEEWTQMLYEYVNRDNTSHPSYQLYHLGTQFSSEVTVPDRPEPFGSKTAPLKSIKIAQQAAARQAVLWLRENGYMNPDAPIKRKGKPETVQQNSKCADSSASNSGKSNRQKVDELCKSYDIAPPEYRCTAIDGSLYSCSAHFVQTPHITRNEPIGNVKNVFGKAAAKEESAKEVLRFMEAYLKSQGV